jgi:hypothetical protein
MLLVRPRLSVLGPVGPTMAAVFGRNVPHGGHDSCSVFEFWGQLAPRWRRWWERPQLGTRWPRCYGLSLDYSGRQLSGVSLQTGMRYSR